MDVLRLTHVMMSASAVSTAIHAAAYRGVEGETLAAAIVDCTGSGAIIDEFQKSRGCHGERS